MWTITKKNHKCDGTGVYTIPGSIEEKVLSFALEKQGNWLE